MHVCCAYFLLILARRPQLRLEGLAIGVPLAVSTRLAPTLPQAPASVLGQQAVDLLLAHGSEHLPAHDMTPPICSSPSRGPLRRVRARSWAQAMVEIWQERSVSCSCCPNQFLHTAITPRALSIMDTEKGLHKGNMCIHIYIYMWLYMCIYMYIYIYRERERERSNAYSVGSTCTWCSSGAVNRTGTIQQTTLRKPAEPVASTQRFNGV